VIEAASIRPADITTTQVEGATSRSNSAQRSRSFNGNDNRIEDETAQGTEEIISFSFAFAAAALEGRAAAQLEVNGATPGSTPSKISSALSVTSQDNPRINARKANSENSPTVDQNPKNNRQSASTTISIQQTEQAKPLASPTISQTTQLPAQGIHLTLQTQIAIRSNTPSRQNDLQTTTNNRSNESNKPVRSPQATRPQATAPNEFAQLVAKKISERASAFDLRLDPPELGKVEGRFSMLEDGKTVLALNFDNQSTMDLFAKDTEGLRLALADAGVDTGKSEFVFAINDSPTTDSPLLQATAHESPAHNSFVANSTGTLNLWT